MEYPAICAKCVGNSPQVNMMRQVNGDECKLCTRPFTVFMWKPSNIIKKHAKTIICLSCARSKNCCQSCMLDINYGIPLDVRDAALKMAGINTDSNAISGTKNREVKAIMGDKLDEKFKDQPVENKKAREILSKLAQKLNETNPKFISKASTANLSKKVMDVKNVDISKVLAKLPFGGVIDPPPADESVTSFFIFGLTDDVPQYLLTEYFNKFGKIKSMTVLHQARCGYISFITRLSAELFANEVSSNGHNSNKSSAGIFILDGKHPIRVSWGAPKPLGETKQEHSKLSLVVSKVLRQLAEKDRDFVKPSKKDATSKVTYKPNSKANKSASTSKPKKF